MHLYDVAVYNDRDKKIVRYTNYASENKDVARQFGNGLAQMMFPDVSVAQLKVHVDWLATLQEGEVR